MALDSERFAAPEPARHWQADPAGAQGRERFELPDPRARLAAGLEHGGREPALADCVAQGPRAVERALDHIRDIGRRHAAAFGSSNPGDEAGSRDCRTRHFAGGAVVIPFRGRKGRKPRNDQEERAVSRALHQAFDPTMDEGIEEEIKRLIKKMKGFEESGGVK